jgi:hypothetical protein
MNLVNVIRKARKIFRDENNPIEAIKSIRTTTGVGLKAAKDFWDWMDANGDGLSAPKLAGHWCEEHWQDNENCGCPSVGITHAASAGAEKIMPDLEEFSPSPKPVAAPPSVSDLIRANRDRCPCGRKPCTDGFHANLAALIRKHGTSRAVELIHIWMGLKEPEDEEQARMVETQPGYRPIYREQQQ